MEFYEISYRAVYQPVKLIVIKMNLHNYTLISILVRWNVVVYMMSYQLLLTASPGNIKLMRYNVIWKEQAPNALKSLGGEGGGRERNQE